MFLRKHIKTKNSILTIEKLYIIYIIQIQRDLKKMEQVSNSHTIGQCRWKILWRMVMSQHFF